ncbi:DUF7573 domain-containing protein [Natrinema versiforme]|uniref:DUF7573 domain-containing protein n=1 Tax=Natrinema versiforme JCM 10478 TaxID=1227496 RepID=L9Y3M7_9EURY|nr:hypothetical protein [Natrinema versiforme]ELY68689.1 hypothetical protein C489_06298 [Natrinema versiforme JCM 10478]
MTDDATLSDFDAAAGADDETLDSAREERDSAADPAEAADESAEAGANDAPHWTYAWGDYTCSRCDSPTERAWRADGEGTDSVCPDCKSW